MPALVSRRHLALAAGRAAATWTTHPGYPAAGPARTAAGRCGAPNVVCDAALRRADGRWVPVVRLRPDQAWMRAALAERGVVPLVGDEHPDAEA